MANVNDENVEPISSRVHYDTIDKAIKNVENKGSSALTTITTTTVIKEDIKVEMKLNTSSGTAATVLTRPQHITNRRSPKRYRNDDPLGSKLIINATSKRRRLAKPGTPVVSSKLSSDGQTTSESPSRKGQDMASTIREDGLRSVFDFGVWESGRLIPALSKYCETVKTSQSASYHNSGERAKLVVQLSAVQVTYLLAKMMPVNDVRQMTSSHLEELYDRCWEYGPGQKRLARMAVQVDPQSAARRTLVKWMSDVCSKMKWTIPSCYSAVACLDAYVTSTEHSLSLNNLPKIAAACLYYACQMQETAVDEAIIPIDRFLNICPEVGTSSEFVDNQVHLVDTLQGGGFSLKTPFDFTLIFLSRLQTSAGNMGIGLYRILLFRTFLPHIFESLHLANLYFYYCFGVCQYISVPHWVFAGLNHTIMYLFLQNKSSVDLLLQLSGLSQSVVSVMTMSLKELAVKKLIRNILLEATHIACHHDDSPNIRRSTSFDNIPIMASPASTTHTSNPNSESARRLIVDGDLSTEEFLGIDGTSEGVKNLPEHHEECRLSPVMDQCLQNISDITATLFECCCQVALSPQSCVSTSTSNKPKVYELPGSSVIGLRVIAQQQIRANSTGRSKPTPRIRTPNDVITIQCIRPQALWIHNHPGYLFDRDGSRLETKMRQEGQQAIRQCRQSKLLFAVMKEKEPFGMDGKETDLLEDGPVASDIDESRRGSVLGQLATPPKKGRTSVQAPIRRQGM